MSHGETHYDELHRPQFHFTARRDWLNDPNGLVYYEGEYHLFFQHTPGSVRWGPNTWGHAVSRDLVHWQQLGHAIEPDAMGWIWSGSAVVDWQNSSGLQTGNEPVLVAFYTVGDSKVRPEKPCVQAIAYSNDRGRTWLKYAGNPVIEHIRAHNHDPRVIWHQPTARWIMALFLEQNDYTLLGSYDLRTWSHLSDVQMPGTGECPDFFELAVDGDPNNRKWVFWGGAGVYRIGSFDGTTFMPETDSLQAELGANGYAAQTWSDIPAADGRRIQMSWMRGGKYPAMPFNQQMSFPVELTLRSGSDGIRLCRQPVREIALLHERALTWNDVQLAAGQVLVPQTGCELFDIRMEVGPDTASRFGVMVRGIALECDVANKTITFLGKSAQLRPAGGRVRLQILVDRTSLEVFAQDGELSLSTCYLPEAADNNLELYAKEGRVKIVSLVVHELCSAWHDDAAVTRLAEDRV